MSRNRPAVFSPTVFYKYRNTHAVNLNIVEKQKQILTAIHVWSRSSVASCVLQQLKPLVSLQSIASSQDLELLLTRLHFPTAECCRRRPWKFITVPRSHFSWLNVFFIMSFILYLLHSLLSHKQLECLWKKQMKRWLSFNWHSCLLYFSPQIESESYITTRLSHPRLQWK